MERLKLRLYITSLKDELGKAMYDYIDQNIPDLVRFYVIQLIEATPEIIKDLKGKNIQSLPALVCDEWQSPVTGISGIKTYFDQVKQRVQQPSSQPVIDTDHFYQNFIDEEYQASKSKDKEEQEPDMMERFHMEMERRKIPSTPKKDDDTPKSQPQFMPPPSHIPPPPANARADNMNADEDINNYLQHEIKSGGSWT